MHGVHAGCPALYDCTSVSCNCTVNTAKGDDNTTRSYTGFMNNPYRLNNDSRMPIISVLAGCHLHIGMSDWFLACTNFTGNSLLKWRISAEANYAKEQMAAVAVNGITAFYVFHITRVSCFTYTGIHDYTFDIWRYAWQRQYISIIQIMQSPR